MKRAGSRVLTVLVAFELPVKASWLGALASDRESQLGNYVTGNQWSDDPRALNSSLLSHFQREMIMVDVKDNSNKQYLLLSISVESPHF